MVAEPELLARAVNNPGRLVLGPSTNAGAFPFGGLSMGFTRRMEARFEVRYHRTRDPASGATAEVGRRSVEDVALGCVIEGVPWNEDMIRAAFTKTTRSADLPFSTPAEARITGSSTPSVVPAMPPILFQSIDPAGECVYFRRPVLLLDLREAIALSHNRKAGMPVIFVATPVLNMDPWSIARMENQVIP